MAPISRRRWAPRGEFHHKAVLTDHEVDLVRALRRREPGYWTYARLAEKFEISKSQVRNLVKRRQRL